MLHAQIEWLQPQDAMVALLVAPSQELVSLHADVAARVGRAKAPAALCEWPARINIPLGTGAAAFSSHTNGSTSYSSAIPWGGPTTVLLVVCDAAGAQVHAQVQVANPPSTYWALFSSAPREQHLSVSGARQVPVHEVASLLFALLLVLWEGAHQAAGRPLGLIRAALLLVALLQALRFALSVEWLRQVAITGDDRAPPYAVATFFEGLARSGALFVYGLLAHGVGTHQYAPSKRVISALGIGCLFFLAVILAQISCSEDSTGGSFPSQCVSLQLGTFLLQCMIALGVVIMGNFNINILRAEIQSGGYTPRTQLAYESLRPLQTLRLLMVLLLILPTVQLIVQLAALNFRSFWGVLLLEVALDVALLTHAMSRFAPGALSGIWKLRRALHGQSSQQAATSTVANA